MGGYNKAINKTKTEETKMKKFLVSILAAALMLGAAACGSNDTTSTENTPPTPPTGESGGQFDNLGGGGTGTVAEAKDTTEVEQTIAAAVIDLADLSAQTDISGATEIAATDEAVTITEAGNYVLTGNYTAGVTVTVENGETTHLFLKNANITNENDIALYNSNKKSALIVTVVDGTENTVFNSGLTAKGKTVNAVEVKGELMINGTGKLSVTSDSKNAVKVSKGLKIVDAEIVVDSANHGIAANTINAKDCTITVANAAKDGLQAECDDEVTEFTYDEGYISLVNVKYTSNTKGDGMQADTYLYIGGGEYDITTVGEWVTYSTENIATYELETDDYRWTKSGSTYKKIASDEVSRYSTSNLYALAQGCKGLKVGEIDYEVENEDGTTTEGTVYDGDYTIVIDGGTFNINTPDDGVHANSGDVIINDGTFTISTLDDGIGSDNLTKINGGKVTVLTSYEGIEGAYVEIGGGEIDVYATDDGINAASDDVTDEHIIISGGTTIVNADGDGLDSNGSVLISGGTVFVHGPTNGGNASLDSESGIVVNGGYFIAVGSSGMVETPAQNSSQNVVSYTASSTIAAGSTISLRDSSGNVITSITTKKVCQSVIISCPELTKGSSYSIYVGDTQAYTFTVSSTITGSNGQGGFGPGGNMGPGGGFGPRG